MAMYNRVQVGLKIYINLTKLYALELVLLLSLCFLLKKKLKIIQTNKPSNNPIKIK